MNLDLVKAEVTTATNEVAPILELATSPDFQVTTRDEYAMAAECAQDVKRRHKDLEAKRTSITKPLLEAKRAVDDLFSKPLKSLEFVEARLKKLMGDFTIREREEQRRVMEAAAEAARGAATREQVVAAMQEAQGMAEAKATGVTVREVVDTNKIAAAVAAGARDIPGVRIYQVWTFEVMQASEVPPQYRTASVTVRT